MTEQQTCAVCGVGGHAAAQCNWRTDAALDKIRAAGLSIDGDNAYKRDLLDSAIGALAFGKQGSSPPPEGHWGWTFYGIGKAEAEERDRDRRIMQAMALDLGRVGEALGIPGMEQEGGADELIYMIGELRAALEHIIKTVAQSRTETRRLRWIAQRAQWALDGKEYDDSAFDLPKDSTSSNEKLKAASQQLQQRLDELTYEAGKLCDAVENKDDLPPVKYALRAGRSVNILRNLIVGAVGTPQSWLDVQAERRRQVEAKGWTPEHDDGHACDEIAAFAALYIMPPAARDWDASSTGYGDTLGCAMLPDGWIAKIGDRRRELVKGTALALAELERFDRAEGRSHGGA